MNIREKSFVQKIYFLLKCWFVVILFISCYEDLDNSFQKLEGVSPEGVKILEILNADITGMQKIYKKMAVAQQFTPEKKYLLYEVRLAISRVGSFLDSDYLKVTLCYDNSDNPSTSSGYFTYDVKLNAISQERSEHVFVFKNRPTVEKNKKYWIKVYFANSEIGDETNNYILFYQTNGDAYVSHYLKTFDGTQWNEVVGADLGITIWGKEQL